jgi:hypothetical protein
VTNLPTNSFLSTVVDEATSALTPQLVNEQKAMLVVLRSDHRLFRFGLSVDICADIRTSMETITSAAAHFSPLALAVVAVFHDPSQLHLPGRHHLALMAEDIDHQTYSELAVVDDDQLQLLGRNGRMPEVEQSLLARAVTAGLGAGLFS